MPKTIVAFIYVHNSCRSKIAEALGNLYLKDNFVCYSAGIDLKSHINQDAVRLVKELYGIDMENNGQKSKLISSIPNPDLAISMGCGVTCPFIGRAFDDNWNLEDPTEKGDDVFIRVIKEIENKVLKLKDSYHP